MNLEAELLSTQSRAITVRVDVTDALTIVRTNTVPAGLLASITAAVTAEWHDNPDGMHKLVEYRRHDGVVLATVDQPWTPQYDTWHWRVYPVNRGRDALPCFSDAAPTREAAQRIAELVSVQVIDTVAMIIAATTADQQEEGTT